MSFIHCMGRFWGLAEDKMLVPAPVGDMDPMAWPREGFPACVKKPLLPTLMPQT